VALATVVCFALACGQARARTPAGAGVQVNSPAFKNSADGNPYFLCQAIHTPPSPRKNVPRQKRRGRRTALKKPKLPITAVMGSFPHSF